MTHDSVDVSEDHNNIVFDGSFNTQILSVSHYGSNSGLVNVYSRKMTVFLFSNDSFFTAVSSAALQC